MALRKESRLRSLPPASEVTNRDYDEPIKLKALQAPVLTGAPPPPPPPPGRRRQAARRLPAAPALPPGLLHSCASPPCASNRTPRPHRTTVRRA